MVLVFLARTRVQKFSLAGTASWWSLLYLRVPQEWIMWGSIEMCTCTRSVFRGGVLVLVASQRAIVVVGATTELQRRYPLLSRMLTCSWCATASISTAFAAARCRGYIRIRIRYSYSRSKQVELHSGMIDRSVQQQQFECRYEPYSSLRQ